LAAALLTLDRDRLLTVPHKVTNFLRNSKYERLSTVVNWCIKNYLNTNYDNKREDIRTRPESRAKWTYRLSTVVN
jgi:hypothetical protein